MLAALLLLTACRERDAEPTGPGADAAPAALASFQIRDGDSTLVFQYAQPASGELRVARRLADIPEPARGNVFVLSTAFRKGDIPANLVIVANLSTPAADGTYPFRLVSRYDRVRPLKGPAGSAASDGTVSPAQDTVLLFSTSWCPHCRTARQWLQASGVPFEEKNVESDSAAQRLLADLGRKQGLPDHMLNSVPILYVKGKLVLGFNQVEVARLLGK